MCCCDSIITGCTKGTWWPQVRQTTERVLSRINPVVVYGSPYVWEEVRSQIPSNTPAVFTYGQMDTAQAIALQPLLGQQQDNLSAIDNRTTGRTTP